MADRGGDGITRQNAGGKNVLVHGAAGGLGMLALQTLSHWRAQATAIAKASDLATCLKAGAADAVARDDNPFAKLSGRFDATLNFAAWDDESKLLSCLREGALGQATTVHPLVQSLDERGWIGAYPTKAEDARRFTQRSAQLWVDPVFDRRPKRFRKWRGSSSSVGSLFRSESGRLFATRPKPSTTCAVTPREERCSFLDPRRGR